jgi:D-amino peptidase
MSSRTVKRYVLNGSDIGEIGLRAAIAGVANVPVLYLNGDDKACAEARAIMPWITITTTKISVGLQTAKELARDAVIATIVRDVGRALEQFQAARPYFISAPVRLSIQLRWPYAFLKTAVRLFRHPWRNLLRFEAPNIAALVDEKVL